MSLKSINFEMSLKSNDDELVRKDYRFEKARLQSYNYWIARTVSSSYIQLLAKAGFYYTGEGDKVKCFDCDVVISGWKEEIDPMTQHRIFLDCRFVRMMPSCGNVPLVVDAASAPPRVPKMNEILQLDPLELNLNKAIDVYFECEDYVARVNLGDLIGAKNPAFAYFNIRLQTYVCWPETLTQKKSDMAFAGFICKNEADKVVCFYCGGCVANWEPHEEPLYSHFNRFPNCNFIKRLLAG